MSIYEDIVLQPHYEAENVVRVRMVPDHELTHRTFTGTERDERNQKMFYDRVPDYIVNKDGKLIAWL